jgi:hypothetical protein
MTNAGPEPQPCGTIASATWCCEYHAIHSDDEFSELEALLDEVLQHADLSRAAAHPLRDRVDAWRKKRCHAP